MSRVVSQLSLYQTETVIKPTFDQDKLDELDELVNNFIDQAQNDIVLYRYEKNMTIIYTSLKQVILNESDLISKINKLKYDHKELTTKFNQAIKLASVDKATINELTEKLDKAWELESKAKSKEKRALETLNSLKLEISNLSKLVEQAVGLTMGQEYNLRELTKEKENILLDNKYLNIELDDLKQRLKDLKLKESDQEKIIDEAKLQVANAKHELLAYTIQIQQNMRRIEKQEEENSNLKRLNDLKEANLNQITQNLNALKLEFSKQDQTSKDYQSMIEKSKKENDILSNRLHKIQHEMENLFNKNDSLQIENSQLIGKIKQQEDLNEELKQDLNQIHKIKDTYDRKFVQFEQDKIELNREKHELESRIDLMNKNHEKFIKDLDASNKKYQQQENEKTQLTCEILKLKSKIDNLENDLNESKQQIRKVNFENDILKKEINKLEEKIEIFNKEKTNIDKTKNDFLIKIDSLNHQLKLKSSELNDLNKKLKENESKLDKLNRLHENVRIERNNLSKINNQSKEQITQLKDLNENLKLNLTSKIDLLKQNKLDYDKLLHENNKVEKNINKIRDQMDLSLANVNELKEKVLSFEMSELKLLQIIHDLNKKIEIKNKSYEKIALERNIFGTQLVRRNDEISLLYEKIKLIENLNQRGENAFKRLANEFKLNQTLLNRIKREKEIKMNENFTLKKYKQQLLVVQEEIILEKAKRDVAEKRMNNNVHRWRKLRGSDPTKYELITKCNFLQKKLIQKCTEIFGLQLKFQEKDRLFAELSKSMSRRLISQGFKSEYNYEIEIRNKQIKCLLAENTMLSKLNENSTLKTNDLLEQLKEYKLKCFKLKSLKK